MHLRFIISAKSQRLHLVNNGTEVAVQFLEQILLLCILVIQLFFEAWAQELVYYHSRFSCSKMTKIVRYSEGKHNDHEAIVLFDLTKRGLESILGASC